MRCWRKGYYRGSSVLVTGTAGTGKTSLGAHFLDAACARGERALFFSFEESPEQIIRNLRSVGIDLGRWVKKGLLHIESSRPSTFGFEMHLVRMHHLLENYKPKVVMMDPVSGLLPGGSAHDVNTLVLRIVDSIKERGATAVFTSLSELDDLQSTSISISSLVDTWILLRNIESSGERNRVLYVLKSRGMAHSNQIREFLMTSRGVRLRNVYLGPGGVLTGSARVAQEAEERREEMRARQESQRLESAARSNLRSLDARIAALMAEKETHERELSVLVGDDQARRKAVTVDREALGRSRSILGPSQTKGVRPNGREGA